MEESKCTSSLVGKIFGHKYLPIYDIKKGNPLPMSYIGSNRHMLKLIEASRGIDKTYVYSICKRCGDVIKRNKSGG